MYILFHGIVPGCCNNYSDLHPIGTYIHTYINTYLCMGIWGCVQYGECGIVGQIKWKAAFNECIFN